MNGLFEAFETAMSCHRKEFFDSLSLILLQQSTPDGQMVFRYNERFVRQPNKKRMPLRLLSSAFCSLGPDTFSCRGPTAEAIFVMIMAIS